MPLTATQSRVPLLLGDFSMTVKWPQREAHYCPPASSEVKNMWYYYVMLTNKVHFVY